MDHHPGFPDAAQFPERDSRAFKDGRLSLLAIWSSHGYHPECFGGKLEVAVRLKRRTDAEQMFRRQLHQHRRDRDMRSDKRHLASVFTGQSHGMQVRENSRRGRPIRVLKILNDCLEVVLYRRFTVAQQGPRSRKLFVDAGIVRLPGQQQLPFLNGCAGNAQIHCLARIRAKVGPGPRRAKFQQLRAPKPEDKSAYMRPVGNTVDRCASNKRIRPEPDLQEQEEPNN